MSKEEAGYCDEDSLVVWIERKSCGVVSLVVRLELLLLLVKELVLVALVSSWWKFLLVTSVLWNVRGVLIRLRVHYNL